MRSGVEPPFLRSPGLGLAVSLVPVLAALVASTALVVDYVRPIPVYCTEGGGCDALRHTAIAAPLGVPLPALGVAGFFAMGLVALLPGRRARVAQLLLSGAAALTGAGLLVAQLALRNFCPYCCVVDASGIASLLAAAWRMRSAAEGSPPLRVALAGAASLPLAVLIPLVAGLHMSTTPRVIRDEMAATPRGEATIVDFVDFECPFCRMTHAELEPLVQEHRSGLRLVRRQVPLSSHPHAHDAARAACCGEQLGQGDAMADALFAAPVEDLTPEGCERIAQRIGLPIGPYRACVSSPATEARIEADRAEFKAAGGYALPTLWIGDEELVGAQPREALAGAIQRALTRAGS